MALNTAGKVPLLAPWYPAAAANELLAPMAQMMSEGASGVVSTGALDRSAVKCIMEPVKRREGDVP